MNGSAPAQGRVETRYVGLYTGLGPPIVVCGNCGELVRVGRKEWESFVTTDRRRFVIASVVEVVAFSFAGAILGGAAVKAFSRLPWAEKTTGLSVSGFYFGAAMFALLGTALQTYRVVASKRRSASDVEAPYMRRILELQTNLQLKATILILAMGAIIWIAGYAMSK